MRGRTSDNVNKIQVLGVQHFLCRGISSPGCRLGSLERKIAGGDDLDICHATPGFPMILGEEPASNQAALEFPQLSLLADSR